MIKIIVAFAWVWVLLISCVSAPESVPESVLEDDETPVPAVEEVTNTDMGMSFDGEAAVDTVVFDPKNPPVELYAATLVDIQNFIQSLDILIKAKDYDEWLKLLAPSYYERINTAEFLDTISQQPRLKSQNIVLRNSRDYFLNVVVASRADLQANDIEFFTMTRVMVFTINQKGEKIRIYTLDKTPGSWEIVE
jgi:hypothetical protein